MKLKSIKIEKVIDELQQEKEKYERGLERTQDEEPIGNGLTNKSSLGVTIYQGKDILGGESSESFLTLNIADENGATDEFERQETKPISNKTDPKWNEKFKFNIKKPNQLLKIEGLTSGIMGNSSLGEVIYSLNDLTDMQQRSEWREFTDDGTPNGQPNGKGKIFLKIQFLYNMKKYFDEQIRGNEKLKSDLEQILGPLQECIKYSEEPFGTLTSGKLADFDIVELMGKGDEILSQYEQRRVDLFAYKSYEAETPKNVMEGIETIGKNVAKTVRQSVSWGNLTKVMMLLLVVLSFLTLLARTDFVNFVIGVVIWMLFIYDKNNDVLKYLMNLIYVLGGSLAYDLLWLMLQFSGYFKGIEGDNDIGLKRFTYLLSLINVGVKVVLLLTLNSLKQKKEQSQNLPSQ